MIQPTLTVEQAAGYLHVQPRTIRDWIAAGKLPAKKVGKRYIIAAEAVGNMVAPASPMNESIDISNKEAHAAQLFKLLSKAESCKESIRAQRRKDAERQVTGEGRSRL